MSDRNLIRNAFRAVSDGANWIMAGAKIDPEADAHLAICKSCEHYKNEHCSICGCWMKLKTKMSGLKCPIDKW